MQKTVYAFDLDGTVTECELLPVIARELDLVDEMALLTQLTLNGTLHFEASFKLRFHILKSIPVPIVQDIVASVPLNSAIAEFIDAFRDDCVIVTGNLDCWVAPLLEKLGCRAFTSRSRHDNGQLALVEVLDKGVVARMLRNERRLVAIGESFSDIALFEAAATGIAYGGVHAPVPELVQVADYTVQSGAQLCRLLRELRVGNH